MRKRAEAALFFNTVVWGATFVLVKSALDAISPFLFLTLRFALAGLALVVLFRVALARKFSWADFTPACATSADDCVCSYALRATRPESRSSRLRE